MAGQTDDDRPGREPVRALITACGVLLAGASLAALVLTDNPKHLRVALVGALWAFLLVSITGRFRPQVRHAASESDEELRRFYQMELQQEVAARREYELRLEVQLRRELEESRTKEIEELRAEVHRLRAELMGIEAPDRAALLASAARLSPEQLRVLKEEAQRAQPRPAERLQLPAGFSDSPPPSDSSPSFAPSTTQATPTFATSTHSSDPQASQPGILDADRPSATRETFAPTEFVPAASHGAYAESASAASASYRLPEPYRRTPPQDPPANSRTPYRPVEAHQGHDARGVAETGSSAESSGVHRTPSQSWSSYVSPTASQELRRPSLTSPSYATPSNGYDSSPSYGSTSSNAYSSTGPDQHPVIEPYDSGPRHSVPSVEIARPVPFDPSNTWPGAFKAARDENKASNSTGASESYPSQPAEWRPAEQSTSRGRHHAGDDDDEDKPASTTAPRSRPEDDVLAQILGRW